MLIDLHVHIKRKSSCARMKIEELSQVNGIDGVVILDHNYHTTEDDCLIIKDINPKLIVWRGIELSIKSSNPEEHLVLITQEFLPFKYDKGIDNSNLSSLITFLKSDFVYSFIVHPYRRSLDIALPICHLIDGIELFSRNTSKNARIIYKIAEKAIRYEMNLLSCSDAHRIQHVGSHYVEFEDDISSYKDLFYNLKSNLYLLKER